MLRFKPFSVLPLAFLPLTVVWGQVTRPSVPQNVLNDQVPHPKSPAERYSLGPAPKASLGSIDDSVRDQPARRGLLRVAVDRPVSTAQMTLGTWQNTPSGPIWRLTIRSREAVGLRVHFENFSVGTGEVWVHDTSNPPAKTFGPYMQLGRNKNGDFWSGIVFADSVEVEYKPAAGSATSGLPPFQIAEVGHLWRFGKTIAPRHSSESINILAPHASRLAASPNFQCMLDASCYTNPASNNYTPAVAQAVRSTAFIIFADSSGVYQCSATLLNAPNGSPLLLTAGHCINQPQTAQSLVAVFDTVDGTCQQPPFNQATVNQLIALPQADGIQLLSFADQPFLDESNQNEVDNDLDYSLVLLDNFPAWPNASLSGYNAKPVLPGTQLTSVSAPQGLFLKVAFSTVLDSLWANGLDVDQTSAGRIDSGSSGSGIFDSNGALVGLLSTGSTACSPTNPNCTATACDVHGGFGASYTAFSAVYPIIRNYLNQPLTNTGVALPADSSLFSVSTINNVNAQGYGSVTLTLNAPTSVAVVEIRVGSPSGGLLYRGSAQGSLTTPAWVNDGTVFYLQDVTNGYPLALGNTLATATAHLSAVSFTVTPPVILFPDAAGYGSQTFNWSVPGASLVELRVGSPAGPLVALSDSSGSARASDWVTDGTKFILCDISHGPCSAQNTVATLTSHIATDSQLSISSGGGSTFVALPNPIFAGPGSPYGQTTLYYNVPGASSLQIRVGSPRGALFAQTPSTGTATTGNWVNDGATFYLQDVSYGVPGVTVATVIAHVVPYGQLPASASGGMTFIASPNPIPVAQGQLWGQTTLYYNAPNASSIQVRVGSPTGPLMAQDLPSGVAVTGLWVTDGTTFYLQDISNGMPGTTVAATTVHLAPQ